MVDAAVFDLDIDDGWSLEEAAATSEAPSQMSAAPAREAGEEVETDDGWNVDELAASSSSETPETPETPERVSKPKRASDPSRIVRLPGRVVIYPRRAVREKKLSALWDCALAQNA